MPRYTAALITLISCGICFYAGLYVGTGQGALYALGIEATSAKRRLHDYRLGEAYEGEYEEQAEQIIDQNITYFGEHLRRHYVVHQIPSPWSISSAGMSFMEEVTRYRLENPRRNDEKRKDILDPDKTEETLQSWMKVATDESSKHAMSEENALEFAREVLMSGRQKERDYQRAIRFVREAERDDS
ncbi:MAG: hypothetical protein AAF756_22605 [Pseudomonadota bacterium]